jgi:NADH:ubiquinone oxidoreductase subunit H
LCFGSATLLTAASLIDGGRRGARWSLWLGVRAALGQWLALLPAWLAIVASCFPSGLDVDELVRAQGPLPYHWNAFANPGFTLLFGALLLGALPTQRRSPGGLRHARSSTAFGRYAQSGWLAALHSCSLCAVAALAFLGGDAWTGAADAAGPAMSAARFIPSLLLWLKYTGLCCGATLLGSLLERPTLSAWTPLSLRICLPLSLAGAVLAYAWRALEGRSDFWRWALSGYGPALLALLVLALLALPWQLVATLRRPDPAPGLSPWL